MLSTMKRGLLNSEPNYFITGLFGAIFFSTYYFVWVNHELYESAGLRLFCAALCIMLAATDRWPRSLKKYSLLYWYFVLITCLPFFFTFMTLQNNFSNAWVMSSITAIFILSLLIDWLNHVIISAIGIVLAVASVYATSGVLPAPGNVYIIFWLAFFSILSALILNFRNNSIARARVQTLKLAAAKTAHEIKVPLVGINLGLHGLLQRARKSEAVSFLDDIQKLVYFSQNMSKTIEMLLVNSGLRAIEIERNEEILMGDCVQEAVKTYPFYDPTWREKVTVEVHDNFAIHAQRNLIVNVMYNLINNSIRAISLKGAIRITVTGRQIIVRDTGTGIPAGILARLQIGEIFSSSKEEHNLGLGLHFVRQLMVSLAGSMSITSQEGEYTEVSLKFS